VISSEYLDILRRKMVEKAATYEIKICKKKDKEDREVKRITKLGFATERTT
jgi:hypothetical protein